MYLGGDWMHLHSRTKADILQDLTKFSASAKSWVWHWKFSPVKLNLNMQLFSSVHSGIMWILNLFAWEMWIIIFSLLESSFKMNWTYDYKSHILCMDVWRSVRVDLTVWVLTCVFVTWAELRWLYWVYMTRMESCTQSVFIAFMIQVVFMDWF